VPRQAVDVGRRVAEHGDVDRVADVGVRQAIDSGWHHPELGQSGPDLVPDVVGACGVTGRSDDGDANRLVGDRERSAETIRHDIAKTSGEIAGVPARNDIHGGRRCRRTASGQIDDRRQRRFDLALCPECEPSPHLVQLEARAT